MTCGIYGIRNDVNGKWYIGQSKNIEKRNNDEKRNIEKGYIHPSESSNAHFNRAIRKYGKDAFSFHLIEECSEADINEREAHYISLYNSKSPNGYNLTSGGTSGTKGYKYTNDQRKKMSETQKQMVKDGRNKNAGKRGPENHMYGKPSPMRGRKVPRWQVEKAMSKRRSFVGDQNPNYGKHASEKTKQIWAEQRRGRVLSEEWKKHISESSPCAKSVVCVETGEVFRSLKAAADAHQRRSTGALTDACRDSNKTFAGYHWRYAQ